MPRKPVTSLPTTRLHGGAPVPVLGQGTWGMGERTTRRAEEIAALRLGVELGMTLIDTAEMYGDGAAEGLIADALGDWRDKLFLVDKVLPGHATRRGTVDACEASLKRLKTDWIDLYLLHWRGSTPVGETLEAFRHLEAEGKIRSWGVSNFDIDDLEELAQVSAAQPATNQVLYNLTRRGIEHNVLPWCQTRHVPVMAYSPVEQGRLLGKKALVRIADRLSATPAQVALSWILRQPHVVAIPKAAHPDHVRENRAALEITLSATDLDDLNRAFPAPPKTVPLEML
jgi:diketogulonate reductase-like aldo/keto reductase